MNFLQHVSTPHFYEGLQRSPAEVDGIVRWIAECWDYRGTIVDLGVGDGAVIKALRQRESAERIVGVDREMGLLRRIRTEAQPIQADLALSIPLRSGVVTVALCVSLVHLLPDKQAFFHEVSRVLEPRGKLFLVTCSEADLQHRFMNQFAPSLPAIDRGRYGALSRLKAQARKAGLDTIRVSNVRLGHFVVDRRFLHGIQTRPWSSLALLSDAERKECFERLEAYVRTSESCGLFRRIPFIRTGIEFQS